MQRRIADISTNFSVEGLAAAQRELSQFARQVGATMRQLNATKVGIDVTGTGKAAMDRLAKDEATYSAVHNAAVQQRVDAEVAATAEAARKAGEIRAAAEAEYRAVIDQNIATRIATETAGAEDIAATRLAIEQAEQFRFDEWKDSADAIAREQDEVAQTESLKRIAAIRVAGEQEFLQWKRAHAAEIVTADVSAAKQAAEAGAAAKQAADASYVAWWTAQLQEQADKEKAIADGYAAEQADADKRVIAETAAAKKQADQDYQSWWEDQLSQRENDEKQAAADVAAAKQNADQNYIAWWNSALQDQEKQQEQLFERGRNSAESFGRFLNNILAGGLAFSALGQLFDGLFYQLQKVAILFGAAAAVVRSMIGTVGTIVTGFGKVAAAAIKAAKEIVVMFGTALVKAAQFSASLVGLAAKLAAMGAAAAAAGGVIAIALGKKAITSTQDLIQSQQQVANTLGISTTKFAEFSASAEYAGLSVDDLRQAMSQFLGVVGQAAEGGNKYADIFKDLGVQVKDAAGNIRSFNDVLHDFAVASAQRTGAVRTNLLSQIFGDDDATKVGILLDKMAGSTSQIAKNMAGMNGGGEIQLTSEESKYGHAIPMSPLNSIEQADPHMKQFGQAMALIAQINTAEDDALRDQYFQQLDMLDKVSTKRAIELSADQTRFQSLYRMHEAGILLTQKDVDLSNQFKMATTELSQAFEGLKLAIFRAFGPTIGAWIRLLAMLMRNYRTQIVDSLVGSFNRFIVLVRDAIAVFGGYNVPVKNMWLFRVKELAADAIEIFKAMVPIAIEVGKIMVQIGRDLDGALQQKTGKGVLDWLKSINASDIVDGLLHLRLVVKDLLNILSGKDYNVETDIGRQMIGWRNTIEKTVDHVLKYAKGLFNAIASYAQGIPAKINEVMAAIAPVAKAVGGLALEKWRVRNEGRGTPRCKRDDLRKSLKPRPFGWCRRAGARSARSLTIWGSGSRRWCAGSGEVGTG